jgi:parallel beta-helix repeat protein
MRKRFTALLVLFALTIACNVVVPLYAQIQKFVHPGIDQSAQDLAYMKKMVLQGEQPYKNAFNRLKVAADLNYVVKPYTHVLRGSYGKPNIGGDELAKSAQLAYNCALVWYITQDKAYSSKAIEILNAWSPVLWDFDYNDAKLLAAWTGHVLCNAAEILRYTNAGWQQKDIDSFSNMLMTVYYPLLRYYYPQANGNWDGAIIHSILAMAVFTDNRDMFQNAVNHYLRAPLNGSIFKYIYPSGQCQETTRDQAHVQLGLGEFAGAAQIAYTQGIDLFSVGNNRLALGYEYTAGFLLGQKPQSYGRISERAKALRDDYEAVYAHYTARGVEMPYTKMALDSVRPKASRSILTAVREPAGKPQLKSGTLKPSTIGYVAGAGASTNIKFPANAILVSPGQSLQEALQKAAGTGRWVVAKAGVHTLPTTLKIPSSLTLAGEGLGTILFLDPASGEREALVNLDTDLHDVTIRDLVVEGAVRTELPSDPNSTRSYRGGYNRGGIIFRALKEGQMKRINFTNLTVRNCTFNGVLISGASDVNITRCDFDENGSNIVPGPKLQHNLLITHSNQIRVKDSRLDTSPHGSGLALNHCRDAEITNCEIARNAYYGVLISESDNITVTGNLIEANDHSGVMLEYLFKGSEKVTVSKNQIQYNNGFGVESYAVRKGKIQDNIYAGNGNNKDQQKISKDKYLLMP